MSQKRNILSRAWRFMQRNILQGQVQIDSHLGTVLRRLATLPVCKNYVEIGTWNGRGSTRCIVDVLRKRKDNSCLWSLETNRKFYRKAFRYWLPKIIIDRYKKITKLHLLYGRIVELKELPSLDQITASPLFEREHFDRWYLSDLENYKHTPNILTELPLKIDVLFLDGGEYSTMVEFEKLIDRTDVIVLDDIRVFKSNTIVKNLKNNGEWECILEIEDERNGFFVGCRKDLPHKNQIYLLIKNHLLT